MALRSRKGHTVLAWALGGLGLGGGCTDCGGPPREAQAEAELGPAGGTLQMAGVRLEVPPGALETTWRVTVDRRNTALDGTPGESFEFGPDGLAFSTPARLSITDDRTAEAGQQVVVAKRLMLSLDGGPELPRLLVPPQVATGRGEVAAEIDGFSAYGSAVVVVPITPLATFTEEPAWSACRRVATMAWNGGTRLDTVMERLHRQGPAQPLTRDYVRSFGVEDRRLEDPGLPVPPGEVAFTYVYRLSTLLAVGNGAALFGTQQRLVFAPEVSPPDPVEGLTVSRPSAEALVLGWSSSGAGGFLIRRSPPWSSIAEVALPGEARHHDDQTEVQPGLDYTYSVAARSRSICDGNWLTSEFRSASSALAPPGAAGSLVAQALSNSEVELRWSPAAGAAEYRVEWARLAGGAWQEGGRAQGVATRFVVGGLAAATAYALRLTPINRWGDGPAASASATTLSGNPATVCGSLVVAVSPAARSVRAQPPAADPVLFPDALFDVEVSRNTPTPSPVVVRSTCPTEPVYADLGLGRFPDGGTTVLLPGLAGVERTQLRVRVPALVFGPDAGFLTPPLTLPVEVRARYQEGVQDCVVPVTVTVQP